MLGITTQICHCEERPGDDSISAAAAASHLRQALALPISDQLSAVKQSGNEGINSPCDPVGGERVPNCAPLTHEMRALT